MKIRILKNSLRFRLKQQDVHEFEQQGKIMEMLEFGEEPKDQIGFGLKLSTGKSLSVSFNSNTTIVHVPKSIADEWTGTNIVGFNGTIDTGMGRTIEVLVEKDFKCLDGREEENEGSYPNPKESC